jgi:hypothetical protein
MEQENLFIFYLLLSRFEFCDETQTCSKFKFCATPWKKATTTIKKCFCLHTF